MIFEHIKRFSLLLLILSLTIFPCGCNGKSDQNTDSRASSRKIVSSALDDGKIRAAFLQQQSNILVESTGMVERILEDDIQVPRHQKFIVRLQSGQTLLINHNIDLAERIGDLKVGDRIYFRGQYEWNEKGGMVHWTHHDPQGRHPGGWLQHNGKRYQ